MMVLALTLPISFEKPAWLWLGLLVPAIVLLSFKSLAGLDPVRRVSAVTVRCVLILLIAACLAGVQYVRQNDDLTVMLVMDRSYSTQQMHDAVEQYLHDATRDSPPDDRVGMIDFARNAYLQQLPMKGGYHLEQGRLPPIAEDDRTNIAGAVRLAMAMFPADTTKRIVLLSDGNENLGDVLTEARRAQANGIPVDVVPLWYQHRNDVYFERMIAPTHAEEGEQLPIRMVLNTTRPTSGTVEIYQNGELVELPPEAARVALVPGSNTFFMKLPVRTTGPQRFRAAFRPDDESLDAVGLNNTANAFTFVAGKSRVLLLSAEPAFDEPLADALLGENINVDLRDAATTQLDLIELQSYSSVILANVPASMFTDEQLADLATSVKDLGGGLIMTGGDEGFGAGGWIGTPIEEVMPVDFEIKHKRVIPRGALVIISHSCEIPRGNYWGKEMAKKSVDTISSRDYIGVLAYSWSPGGVSWEVPLQIATNKAAVKARIDKMQIGDMPDFAQTMQMALKSLQQTDAAQKHVIVISDGDPSPPSNTLLNDFKTAGITISTIGIGWGAHVMQTPMQNIATATGGKFYAPKNPKQLPQIFVKESKVIRRPLIIEEAFKPQVFHSLSDLLAGLDPGEDIPPLGGLVLTSPKESPNVQVPLIRATDDGNDPILAHWQYELGKTVAFTSGFWPRWGPAWTDWSKYAKLWAQIVRWTMRQESPANFDTYTRIEGDRGRVVVDALDKDANYLNALQFRSTLIKPDKTTQPLQFTQTGPGHYEAEFDVDKMGQYLGTLQVFEGGEHRGTIQTGLTVPYSPEYRDLATNEAILRQVQTISGGRWLEMVPERDNLFSHDLPPSESRRPAWEFVLAWLLLPLFLLDVAVRRLASWLALSIAVELVLLAVLLFGLDIIHTTVWGVTGAILLAELVGWTIRFRYIRPMFEFFTHRATVLADSGERTAAVLTQLKGKREEVREEQTAATDVRRIAREAEETPKGQAKVKFDVGEKAGAAPAGDIHDALGGAKGEVRRADQEKQAKEAAAAAKKKKDEEETTSKLLEARRRRQKKDE